MHTSIVTTEELKIEDANPDGPAINSNINWCAQRFQQPSAFEKDTQSCSTDMFACAHSSLKSLISVHFSARFCENAAGPSGAAAVPS